jgi:phosphatidylserine/phosphatidylglycerophosphate/cardiolipin synthase-like enzyme
MPSLIAQSLAILHKNAASPFNRGLDAGRGRCCVDAQETTDARTAKLERMPWPELRSRANAAAKSGHAASVESIAVELDRRGRSSRATVVRQLLVTTSEIPSPPTTKQPPAAAKDSPGGAAVLINGEIFPAQLRVIKSARKSIWLSSLTFPKSSLTDALIMKADEGVDVTLIVADRKVGDAHDKVVRRLRRAGVDYAFPDSTHSKALVVDEEIIINGSANAHGGHRDICTLHADKAGAKKIIRELQRLFDEVPDED